MQVRIYYYFIFFKQAYELDEASLGIQVSVIFHFVEDYGCSYCEGVFMISVDTTYLFLTCVFSTPTPTPLDLGLYVYNIFPSVCLLIFL